MDATDLQRSIWTYEALNMLGEEKELRNWTLTIRKLQLKRQSVVSTYKMFQSNDCFINDCHSTWQWELPFSICSSVLHLAWAQKLFESFVQALKQEQNAKLLQVTFGFSTASFSWKLEALYVPYIAAIPCSAWPCPCRFSGVAAQSIPHPGLRTTPSAAISAMALSALFLTNPSH